MKKILFIPYLLIGFLSFGQQREIDSLKNVLKTANDDTNKVKTIFKVADLTFNTITENDSILLTILKPAITLSEKLNYSNGLLKAYLKSASYLRNAGKYSDNNIYLEKAIDLCLTTKNNSGLFSIYITKGNTSSQQGDYASATEYFFKSLKIAELMKDESKIANSFSGLGNLYVGQGDCKKAVYYHLSALQKRIKLKDSLKISHSYLNSGNSYLACKNYDSSMYYYSKALHIQILQDNTDGQAYSYSNIGEVYSLKGFYQESVEYYKRAFKLLYKSHDDYQIINTMIGLGNAFLKLKNYDSSIKYYERVKPLAEKARALSRLQIVYSGLSENYEFKNDLKLALKYNRLYVSAKDSVSNRETGKKIASIEYGYQISQEKKVKELEDEKVKIKHEAEIKKQKIIIYTVIVGLLLVFTFLIYVYKNLKEKEKAHKIIHSQKIEVEKKNEIIEEKQKEILDSIHYAKRIQNALLANKNLLNTHIPQSFILFQPKDIVSGDFYWAAEHNGKFYLAICDSTGHGVPGAFMSLLNMGFLNEAIKEKGLEKPNEIFDFVRNRLENTISSDGQKDGMDGILLCIDKKNNTLTYAAANNEPILITNNRIIELAKDKMPVGKGEKKDNFKLYEIEAKIGDTVYLYTDGYADQFGGAKGKKFKYKPLNEMLLANVSLPLIQQSEILKNTFNDWKGNLEQVDDVCLIGIKL